jgi:serpin B
MHPRRAAALALLAAVACNRAPRDVPAATATATTPTPPTPPTPASPASPEPGPAAMPPSAATAPLVTASNALGLDLWAKLATPGNLALSPASISIALTMAWGGAKAATADELRAALHLVGDPDAAMTTWGRLAAGLQSPTRTPRLRLANRLFGAQGYVFEAPYLARTQAAFGAPLEPVDFGGGADAARDHINGWVEAQTERRIRQLIPPGAITSDTRLVLVNAIAVLADWAHPFEPAETRPAPFAVTAAITTPVPTMHQLGTFRYGARDGVQILELPYAGGDLAMWLVLPDQVDGLGAVERGLDAGTLAGWQAAATEQRVAVALPRFTIDPPTALELSRPLGELGVHQAFSAGEADFTGIAAPPDPTRRLYFSAVFHKAFVQIDEHGTEAAAATAVLMAPGGAATRPAGFTADHPFLFFIVDRASGLILFMGRVADPAAAAR